MKRGGVGVSIMMAACICGACEQPSQPNISSDSSSDSAWFEETSAHCGLRFEHHSGHEERHFMPEIMCGGAALVDLDNDGWLDAYLVQGGTLAYRSSQWTNRLFHNTGRGSFEDVTEGSGADDASYGMGVAAGDYDNDGLMDLYVTNVGPNTLLRNLGGMKFKDVTSSAGVGDAGWGSSAAFVDFDVDGDLDLYVCNYLNWSVASELDCYSELGATDYCSPLNYNAAAVDLLYRNNGDGTFSDVTATMGLAAVAGTGLGVVCSDFDGDGAMEIFVANDGMPNRLWVPDQRDAIQSAGRRFTEQSALRGCALDQEGAPKAGMGVDAADVNDDGWADIIVCNLRSEADSLFINHGSYFVEDAARSGIRSISRPFTRFGIGFHDFDNDGRLDLYEANGRVTLQATTHSADPYAEPNLLFRGVGAGRFEPVSPRGGVVPELIATSRAAAFGDIDNDGGIDILVVNRDGPAHLLLNKASQHGRWIMFRVLDVSGRDAFNSVVRLKCGERTMTREVRSAYSYCAANDPRVHFGIGAAPEVADVMVAWPDGAVESFGRFTCNQIITLRRGSGGTGTSAR